MSGGRFDYKQHIIRDITDEILDYVYGHKIDEEDIDYVIDEGFYTDEECDYIKEHKHTIPNRYSYSEKTLNELKNAVDTLRAAEIYAERADMLLSGDDGEEEFSKRLEEDLSTQKSASGVR